MKHDSRYVWYFIDLLVFLGINIFILSYYRIDFFELARSITWFEFLIFALAVYRLTDIITQENVTEFIRAPFMDKDKDGSWKTSEKGLRGFFGTLFSCNACMGVWASMISVYLCVFLGAPFLVFLTIIALSGFERFFSKIENVLAKRG